MTKKSKRNHQNRDYYPVYRKFIAAIMLRALKDGLDDMGTLTHGEIQSGEDYKQTARAFFESKLYHHWADSIGLNPDVKIDWDRGYAGAERWMRSILSSD